MLEQVLESVGKYLGIITLIVTSLYGACKFMKRWYAIRQAKAQVTANLCSSLDTVSTQLLEIKEHLDKLDKQHMDEQRIRTSTYMGQIAVISAILELAECQGVKINGSVRQYYEQNKEALKNELKTDN